MAKGEYGPTSNWELRSNGTLVIKGTGRPWFDASKTFWFDYKADIKKVYVEDGITEIVKNAFSYCDEFETIRLPNTLETIGDFAFAYSGLTNFNFVPDSVTYIGNSAFRSTGITEITFPSGVTEIGPSICHSCAALSSVTIQGNVTSIGGYAFTGTAVTEIALPSSVTSLGTFWIQGNTLKKVYYDGNIEDWMLISRSDMGAFDLYCNGVLQTNITTGAAMIKQYAFDNMKNLNTVTFTNSSVTMPIGSIHAFSNTQITSVTFPSSVTVIPKQCFYNCKSGANITFSGNVTTIAEQAFWTTIIGSVSFANNTQIPAAADGAFTGMSVQAIYVPSALYDAWKADPAWDRVKDNLVAI